jgi:hypothetical protein
MNSLTVLMPSDLIIFLFISSLLLILIGSLLPAHWLPPLPNDKYLHFGGYAILSAFAALLASNMQVLFICLGGLIATGILIECLQHFVPGRHFCWRDILANTAGVCLIGIASLFFYF